MAGCSLTRDEVIERIGTLPGFPRMVLDILATIDDPETNLKVLVDHVRRDPVIAARILSRANTAAVRTLRMSTVRDIFTAISLIGIGSVREMAMIGSVANYVDGIAPATGLSRIYWQHSVAVGVCSQELALHITGPVSVDAALIAGLLHDIGQLWLFRFRTDAFRAIWDKETRHATGIDEAEREQFGVDHSTIGAWLVEHWALPNNLELAIRHHHHPVGPLAEPLVPLVHVAEVLGNALDLAGRSRNRVTTISGEACRSLGLVWTDDLHPLFGRMEARSRHEIGLFA